MTYSPDTIKAILNTFLAEKIEENSSKNAQTSASLATLQLESILAEFREEYAIKEKFDMSLFSGEMLKKK